jgi:hypothetical protein
LKRERELLAIAELPDKSPSAIFQVEHGGRIALIGVGLNQDDDLKQRYGINTFTMDDYVLRLATNQAVYERVAQLRDFPYEHGIQKLSEVRELFQSNGIELAASKRYLQILRAIAGFAVSPAVFNDRVVSAACEVVGIDATRQAFQPLLDELHGAIKALLA